MAEINFLPVCSNCHRVLYDREIGVETDIIDNEIQPLPLKIPHSRITPWRCPFCGEVFETVTMPTKLPFRVPRPKMSALHERIEYYEMLLKKVNI